MIVGVQYPLHDVETINADEVVVPEHCKVALYDVKVIHTDVDVKTFKLCV